MAFSDRVINGSDILLEIDGKVLGCSTSHTINVSSTTASIKHKRSGQWNTSRQMSLSWDGSTDSLFNLNDSGTYVRYNDLLEAMTNGNTIVLKSIYIEDDETYELRGLAIITSINLTAGDEANATYSVNFEGVGSLSISTETLSVDFTGTPTTISKGGSVTFLVYTQGTVDSYLWNFGDGDTSTEATPIHTYTETGVYTVSLTVYDNIGGSYTKVEFGYITVEPLDLLTNSLGDALLFNSTDQILINT